MITNARLRKTMQGRIFASAHESHLPARRPSPRTNPSPCFSWRLITARIPLQGAWRRYLCSKPWSRHFLSGRSRSLDAGGAAVASSVAHTSWVPLGMCSRSLNTCTSCGPYAEAAHEGVLQLITAGLPSDTETQVATCFCCLSACRVATPQA